MTGTPENRVARAELIVDQRHVLDPALTGFLDQIATARRFVGRKCPSCGEVSVPPNPICERCYATTMEDVVVANEGVVRSLSVVYARFAGFPEPPYAIGMVQLDGADTAMLNYLDGVDLSPSADLSGLVGKRCRAVFVDPPRADFGGFKFELIA